MNPLLAALIGAGVVALALVSVVRAYRYNQRVRLFPVIARRAGLAYSETDPFNSTGVAFPLFETGDGQMVTDVMWRDSDRRDEQSPTARVFNFAYFDRRDSGPAGSTKVWHRFSCALAQHNGNWPPIRVAPEGMLDRAFQKLGLPDIEFESEEFNRAFTVQCNDRKFASALIDPQMMEFLLSAARDVTLETKGRFLLARSRPLDPAELPGLLHIAEEFLERIPPTVREVYPSFPDGAGTELFPTPLSSVESSDAPIGGDFNPLSIWGAVDRAPTPFTFAPDVVHSDDDPWDPTPGVDHDLDGHPVTSIVEDPWHDHPLPPPAY
jgi:hypothetical protein